LGKTRVWLPAFLRLGQPADHVDVDEIEKGDVTADE
jgi:hypothetical protein